MASRKSAKFDLLRAMQQASRQPPTVTQKQGRKLSGNPGGGKPGVRKCRACGGPVGSCSCTDGM